MKPIALTPHYLVYESSFDTFEYFFHVAWCAGSSVWSSKDDTIRDIGKFSIPKNVPRYGKERTVRSMILEKTEEVVRSNDIVGKELPVFINMTMNRTMNWKDYGNMEPKILRRI